MSSRPKKKKQSKKGTSTFRGIGWLPTLAEELDAMAKATANQARALEGGLDSPHIFDDQVINHSARVHQKAIDHFIRNREQLDRWLSQELDPGQRREVERLIEVNERVLAGNERVLDLCSQIKRGTIDRIMEEDDFDLAVGALTGKYGMPEFDSPPMAAPLERFEAAQAIHEFVESVLAGGGGDDDIVNHPEMRNYALLLMKIRVSALAEEIDSLVKMFSGFGYFAKLLENMIEMLQEFKEHADSGAFQQPRREDALKDSAKNPPPPPDNTMPFSLPPEITVSKKKMPQGWAFVFRHKEMGELGRLRVQGVGGETRISSDVVGDPADPMTERRRAILEPLAREISREMDRLAGGSGRIIPPVAPPEYPGQVVASKFMQCNHCDAFVAMLIFADDASSPDRLEDYARMMYAEFSRRNLPAWVIGAPLGPGPEAPAYIMKVWPSREPVKCLSPDEFNPVLEKLQASHCT